MLRNFSHLGRSGYDVIDVTGRLRGDFTRSARSLSDGPRRKMQYSKKRRCRPLDGPKAPH